MWDQNILDIVQQIKEDPENAAYTRAGVDPLFSAPENARILVVGQAPGEKAVKNKQYWRDQSGDRLRDWMGVDEDTFYNTDLLAVVPMDFYYPGRGKSGSAPQEGVCAKVASLDPVPFAPSPADSFNRTVCHGLLFKRKDQGECDADGEGLPGVWACLFSPGASLSQKPDLAKEKSLVFRGNSAGSEGLCQTSRRTLAAGKRKTVRQC